MTGFLVFLLGVTIGVSELLTRYQDSIKSTFLIPSSLFYILLNGGAAYLAFFLMTDAYPLLSCSAEVCTLGETTQQVLVAGLSGMAVLRASVMTLNIQGTEVGVGPAALIQVFLNVADRGTDRARAKVRAKVILELMTPISFPKASAVLPATCFALMQNITADEQRIVSDQVGLLESDTSIPGPVKAVLLGLSLLPLVGESGLRAGIELLGPEIT